MLGCLHCTEHPVLSVKAVGAASLSPHLFLSKTALELLPEVI